MRSASCRSQGASIFACHVRDPARYSVVDFDHEGRAISIEEKPAQPKSNWTVTGLYVDDRQAVEIVSRLKPPARGELEIMDVNCANLETGCFHVEKMDRGFT